jgi:hypothetical protein
LIKILVGVEHGQREYELSHFWGIGGHRKKYSPAGLAIERRIIQIRDVGSRTGNRERREEVKDGE